MTAVFSTSSLLKITGGRLISGIAFEKQGSVCADINELSAGQWFFALKDSQTDGHDLLEQAHRLGAIGCIVQDRQRYPFAHPDSKLIGVANPLNAYLELAREARERVNPKVVAITGSSGKSTTRDMSCSIASISFKVHSSSVNRPDARGLAKTLLSMPDDTEVLVVELSQSGRGEISWLATAAKPDIAIITNVGLAHLGTLGSIENIAAAKCELLEALDILTGTAILGESNPSLLLRATRVFDSLKTLIHRDSDIEEIAVTPENTLFGISESESLFEVKTHGEGYLKDAWCAIACGRSLGISDHHIAEGLRRYVPQAGRGNRLIGPKGSLIIDESHSATPESVRAAVSAFLDKRAVPRLRKFVVLGDMEDLGEASASIHANLGNWLSSCAFDFLITIGDHAAHIVRGLENHQFQTFICEDAAEVYRLLTPLLDTSSAVLVDGSDSYALRALLGRFAGSSIEA